MIRDVLTYTLDASFGHWSPRCRFVELFLNGNYEGVYVLMEKIKRNKNRVNIAKLTLLDNAGEDRTGGYIIKIDKTTGSSGVGWYSSYSNVVGNTYYQYEYPKPDVITSPQKAYIQSYARSMEDALYQEKFTGAGSYHDFLNDSSFVDFMIINELAKNVDGYRLSSFLYKGKNDRMNCGPIWDFNLGYGNANYYNGWSYNGFQYSTNLTLPNGMVDSWQTPFWWDKLLRDQSYVAKLKKRWATLRKKELSNQHITFVIDSLINVISEAKDRNYQRWNNVIGHYIWPNYYVGYSFASEVDWMKNWIENRLAYLDYQWTYDLTGNNYDLVLQSQSVYPNPFSDQLTIHLAPNFTGFVWAEIYSINGSLLLKSGVVIQGGEIRLEFSGKNTLGRGLYVLKISQNNRILLTEKVVRR
jgi:hypothetical protein